MTSKPSIFLRIPTFLVAVLLATCGNTLAQDLIVPLSSSEALVPGGQVVHVVDPWIRPPRNVTTQYAMDVPGNFEGYPRLQAKALERVTFVHRTIGRTQRHGVYVMTNAAIVQDYLDGKVETPCGPAEWTVQDVCQVASDTGLNGTSCPNRQTLFPLMEIFGNSGGIEYTTPELGYLANLYGVQHGNKKVLIFDCPWVQGRPDTPNTPGRTSHCIGGMYLVVEVEESTEAAASDGTMMTSIISSPFVPMFLALLF